MSQPHRLPLRFSVVLVFAAGALFGGVGVYGLSRAPAGAVPDPADRLAEAPDPAELRSVAGVGLTGDATPEEHSPKGAERLTPLAAEARSPSGRQAPSGPTLQAESGSATPKAAQLDFDSPALARKAIEWSVSIRAGRAYGAGVLVSKDGLVLTALHVIAGASSLRARLRGADWQPATIVAREEDVDLALLRIESDGREPAPLASALSIGAGDGVLGVGSPKQMTFSVSQGIVSYAGRRLRGMRYLQTDLAVNPGSSGGPVVDHRGHVVALMAFVLRDADGISFATPVDYAFDRFAEHLDGRPFDGDVKAFRAWADGGLQ